MSIASPRSALEPPTTDDRLIWDIYLSAYRLPALAVADELGLFPLLAKAPATADEVSASLSIGPRAAQAMLAVLASVGCLVHRHGRFHLTDTARVYLLPESRYYWGHMLRMVRDVPLSYASLREAVLRDKPSEPEDGKAFTEIWEAADISEERAALITKGMHSHSFPAAMGVARRGNFAGVKRLLDVAGGSGCFCIALASRYPEMRFTVAELPAVCAIAKGYIAEYEVSGQVDTVALDMFHAPFPSGYDAVFFSNIFHDWDRKRCLHLAKRSFEALPSGGRIYLHEMLLSDAADGPLPAAQFSMMMLFLTEGKQFTASELEALLREAGFTELSVTPTYGYYSLVTARKP